MMNATAPKRWYSILVMRICQGITNSWLATKEKGSVFFFGTVSAAGAGLRMVSWIGESMMTMPPGSWLDVSSTILPTSRHLGYSPYGQQHLSPGTDVVGVGAQADVPSRSERIHHVHADRIASRILTAAYGNHAQQHDAEKGDMGWQLVYGIIAWLVRHAAAGRFRSRWSIRTLRSSGGRRTEAHPPHRRILLYTGRS